MGTGPESKLKDISSNKNEKQIKSLAQATKIATPASNAAYLTLGQIAAMEGAEHGLSIQETIHPAFAPSAILKRAVLTRMKLLGNEILGELMSQRKTDEDLLPAERKTYPGGMTAQEVRSLRAQYGFDHPETGVLLDNHTMGRPSISSNMLEDELRLLQRQHGVEGWYNTPEGEKTFLEIAAQFKEGVGEMFGVPASQVLHGPNATDLHRTLLDCFENPKIEYDQDHFSTVHKLMRGGENGTIADIEKGNIAPNTNIVLMSHAGYKTGVLRNLPNTIKRIRTTNPDALIVIDAYQTAGTVPINLNDLGPNVVVLGAGHKQLNSAAGAGYAAFSSGTLKNLDLKYPGWWSEEASGRMWEYHDDKPVTPTDDASKLQTGTGDFFAQGRLVAELAVMKGLSQTGNIQDAIEKIREKAKYQLQLLRNLLASTSLECISPEKPDEVPSYLAFRHPQATTIIEELHKKGVHTDGREDITRISVNKATTDQDIQQGCQAIIEVVGALA